MTVKKCRLANPWVKHPFSSGKKVVNFKRTKTITQNSTMGGSILPSGFSNLPGRGPICYFVWALYSLQCSHTTTIGCETAAQLFFVAYF